MRPVTSKSEYAQQLQSSLRDNLDSKCHNILVAIEEAMTKRIKNSSDEKKFVIPDNYWGGYLNNDNQQQLMREWVSKVYEDIGWTTRWYFDCDDDFGTWHIILG